MRCLWAAGDGEARYNKAELQLTDIAEALQGDWLLLARQLNVSDEEVYRIQTEYDYVCEQALVMLHLWVHKNGDHATGMYCPCVGFTHRFHVILLSSESANMGY